MQSLRTRRSPGKASRTTNGPAKLAKATGGEGTPKKRPARKSTVDDKIKKRMSMRYADISGPLGQDIPAVPNVPSSTARPSRREPRDQDEVVMDRSSQIREDTRISEKKLLENPDFDPEAYLKTKLANSTEAELKALQAALRGAQNDTNVELQRNVFKNYAEFVLISKEISTLENEMVELKESLSEWKSMPSLLHIDDSASLADRKRAARSSIADLRVLYANQMQTLHAQIEGSAKFAPTTSGRHVVAEIDGVFSLNAATYKVDHGVRFVVLDDLVLVARRRRRRNAAGGSSGAGSSDEGKLVAERCWPLSEMLVLDTKDSPSMTNVFKIRHGKETHVYRTEAGSDKKNLLSQFRHVAEELAAKKRKEREGEHERRKSLWNNDGNSFALADQAPAMPDWMSDLALRSGDITGAKAKAEKDARWVGEWSDELTVAIALRKWEQATTLIEQGKAKLPTTPLLTTKLPSLNAALTSSLLTSLSQTSNRKSSCVHLISLLLRLGAGSAARTAFLDMRSRVLKATVRKIRFEGHVGAYVGDLAIVCFMGIKHTADWFLASFKENEVASCFIEWARKQIEDYSEMFRNQVFSSDVEQKVIDEALQITYAQSKKLLQEYGLDFRFLFDELLVRNPKQTTLPASSFSFKDHHMPKIRSERTVSSHSPPTPTRRRSPAPSPIIPTVPPPSTYPPALVLSPTGSGPSSPSGFNNSNNNNYHDNNGGSLASAAALLSPTGFTSQSASMPSPIYQQPDSINRDNNYSNNSNNSRSHTPTSALPSAFLNPSHTPSSPSRYKGSSSSPSAQSGTRSGRGTPVSAMRTPNSASNGSAQQSYFPTSPSSPAAARRPKSPAVNGSSGGGVVSPRPPVSGGGGGRASPAPPPRSMNRPGSQVGHRPPPVAVPQREGMI